METLHMELRSPLLTQALTYFTHTLRETNVGHERQNCESDRFSERRRREGVWS